MKTKFSFFAAGAICLLFVLTISCKKDPPKVIPILSTTSVTNITSTTATSGGTITSDGNSPVTSRGVCWSTNQSPILSDSKTSDGTGIGTFVSPITGLSPGVTYYVRSYATNAVGTAYGAQITILTTTILPVLTTTDLLGISSTTATGGGNITSDGGATVIARGVCWSRNTMPTVRVDSTTNNGTGLGIFTSSITGLSAGKTYYIRSYATNSVGTAYGNQITFNTSAIIPTVLTSAIKDITPATATSGGDVTNDGGSTITARGVCWSTGQTPTVANSKSSDGTGIGNYSSTVNGLTPGTTYFVRAYATNSVGTAYGSQETFTSIAVLPIVSTTKISAITSTTATSGGNITSDGGSSVKARGVCWSTSQNPTITDSKTSDGTGTGSYISSISGLVQGTTYYIKAYATNSIGTAYGNQVVVNTNPDQIISLSLINPISELIISKEFTPQLMGKTSLGKDVTISDFTVTGDDKITIVGKKIIGAKSGMTIIKFKTGTIELNFELNITAVEEVQNLDSYLATPAQNCQIVVPVVVINYYPTLNGIDIDTQRAPNYGSLDPITIENLKKRTIDILRLTKFAAEEGSKFRGYNNPNALPYVGIKIIKYYNLYEIKRGMRLSPTSLVYQPDFFDAFSKINLQNAVDNLGAKEVWFSLRPLSSEYPVVTQENLNPENFINIGESNMSSPTTGDVSNSDRRNDDLPIYSKTYVVYGYNLHRSYSENIENRGHQIESQMSYFPDPGIFTSNERMFLNKFVGISFLPPLNGKPLGRCGNTHFPPNSSVDYDWDNSTIVKSDIEDWKPDGGALKDINNSRWKNIKYNYPPTSTFTVDENNAGFKWKIFWFQSIPGYNNNIPYGNYKISNWWDLFYNWDDANKNKLKLWK